MSRRSTVLLYLGTAAVVLTTLLGVEAGVRAARPAGPAQVASAVELLESLPRATISGREVGNQMLVHNAALFATHPQPERITSAFVGTSRSKVLNPRWMGLDTIANASGNSYNEISYGLVLQAEVARQRFPNLRRVYFEASLLLRRPARLILEPDHRQYLPLLKTLAPLRAPLPGGAAFQGELDAAGAGHSEPAWNSRVLAVRADLRLNKLLPGRSDADAPIPVQQDSLFQQLDPAGRRVDMAPALVDRERQRPEVTGEHAKVQRLRETASWAPWDGLFDVAAAWGRLHGIEVVFFQPPVRSDLYRYQLEAGLKAHVQDLERVARQWGVPFIDLNRPELGYMNDWPLFSDEDHLGTCVGTSLMQAAVEEGRAQFARSGTLLPLVDRRQAEALAAGTIGRCSRPGI